jgi:glucokinase
MLAAFNLENILSRDDAHVVGIDVGGTNLRVGVVNGSGLVWEHRVQADFSRICRELPAEQALPAIVDALATGIRMALDQHPQVAAVGIGFPGFIDPATQQVAQSPNLPGLLNIDLSGPLSRLFGLPVIIENDALAAAYGEYVLSGLDVRSLVYLGLGTGVGGGFILDGKPFPGFHGVAMEVGHIIVEPDGRLCGCGNRGCLEQYASASGVVLSYRELSGRQEGDAAFVARQAEAGDDHALAAYRRAAEALAQGLASILKVLDAQHVVIGGGMSLAWHLMQEAFHARLRRDLIPVLRERVSVGISQGGDHAGILGAALLAYATRLRG